MSRKSSRGNPNHDALGRFCSAGDCKMKSERTSAEYEARTLDRFNREPTEGQIAKAQKIQKSLGVPVPENGTYREYDEYIRQNAIDVNSPTEGQARRIKHLEESDKADFSSDDRYGGNAGSYVGSMKKVDVLLNKDNWEKEQDGCYYCRTHEPKADGTPGTQNAGYRLKPVKSGGKTRYVVQSGTYNRRTGTWSYHDIDRDNTGLKGLVKDDISASIKRAALNETKRYQIGNKQTRGGRKRSPKNMRKTVQNFEAMGSRERWHDNDGKLTFENSYNSDNKSSYTIEQGTTGLHAFRTVTSVQTMRKIDRKGRVTVEKIPHTRTEWVATGCQSEEEAIKACRKHEAEAINKRFESKVGDSEIERWKNSKDPANRIKSRNEYNKILDPVKGFLKNN